MINQLPLCLVINDEHEAYRFTIPANGVFFERLPQFG
jgi:hypothetical protein